MVKPAPDLGNEGNRSQHEREMYKGQQSYSGRMVFYPLHPGKQSRSRSRNDDPPGRPQAAPESPMSAARWIPRQMFDPARNSPMDGSWHSCSLAIYTRFVDPRVQTI